MPRGSPDGHTILADPTAVGQTQGTLTLTGLNWTNDGTISTPSVGTVNSCEDGSNFTAGGTF